MDLTRLTKRQKTLLYWMREQKTVAVSDVAERFGISVSTASVHLHALKDKGAANNTGMGRQSKWFALADVPAQPVNDKPIQQVSSIWHYAERISRAN